MPGRRMAGGCICCGAGGGYHTLPGCPCVVPSTLYMNVIRPDANFGMFQSATLAYGPCPVTTLPIGSGMYSTKTFVDGITLDDFFYRFFCAGGYFCISRIFETSIFGSPFADVVRYRWLSTDAGNSCVPFVLTNGRVFKGGDPVSVVSITE